MIPAGGLNRQLVVSMVAVTGLALATMIAGMIVFYGFVFLNLYPPEEFEAMPDSAWPTRSEWVAFLILWSLGLSVAMVAATRFARRLIRPLDQVASAARRIATGDLAARAVPDGLIFEETRQLVEDFNAMATQLSRVDIEMKTWHAAIAHELRTPLTILRGQLQGFVDGVFVPDKASLQGLVGQVESLGRIVDDLKILSLAQSGRLELRLEAIDLAREAATVIRIARPDLEAAGLSVEPDLPSVEIDGDGARIRQALMALLDNARRHAAPGKLRIETRDTRDHAVLRVSDTGPGMTAQAIAQAFEPFWRADDSRSRESGGTGLGLAVVRAIAQAHGGTVVAGAVVPHGAVFELQFPRQLSSERRNGSLRPGAPAFRELGH